MNRETYITHLTLHGWQAYKHPAVTRLSNGGPRDLYLSMHSSYWQAVSSFAIHGQPCNLHDLPDAQLDIIYREIQIKEARQR